MTMRWVIGLMILIVLLVIVFSDSSDPDKVPKERFDLCFSEDTPGATDEFVAYTPYRCSDSTQTPIHGVIGGLYFTYRFIGMEEDGASVLEFKTQRPWFNTTCMPDETAIWKIGRTAQGKITFKKLSRSYGNAPC